MQRVRLKQFGKATYGSNSPAAESSYSSRMAKPDPVELLPLNISNRAGWKKQQQSQHLKDKWGTACLLARLIDLAVETSAIAISCGYVRKNFPDTEFLFRFYSLPLLAAFLWDLAELTTIYGRHGLSIPPKAHIGVETTIVLAQLSVVGLLGFSISFMQDREYRRVEYYPGLLPCQIAVLALTVLSAGFHLFLLIRACIERHQELRGRRPRVMFITETNQVVYVMSKNLSLPGPLAAPMSWTQTSAPPSETLVSEAGSFPAAPWTALTSTPTALPGQLGAPNPNAASQSTPESTVHARARKPLPNLPPINAPAPRPGQEPPGPAYLPDDLELQRRLRGDAQPQLITPLDITTKFSASSTGMTPATENTREGKVLTGGKRARANSL